jgi:uncharacterized protein YggE
MRMPIGSFALSLLFFSMAAAGQQTIQQQLRSNTIKASATGEYEASPDTAILTCAISVRDKQFRDASLRANKAAEGIKGILKANGMDSGAAELDQLILQPVHEDRGTKRKLTGYRVKTTVIIRITDFKLVGSLLESIAQLDDVDTFPVEYVLKNMEEAKLKAVRLAMAMARKTADAAAQTGGKAAGELSSSEVEFEAVNANQASRNRQFSVMSNSMGSDFYPSRAPMTDADDFPITKLKIRAHVTAIFNLQ